MYIYTYICMYMHICSVFLLCDYTYIQCGVPAMEGCAQTRCEKSPDRHLFEKKVRVWPLRPRRGQASDLVPRRSAARAIPLFVRSCSLQI